MLQQYQNILTAVDGSDEAKLAFQKAVAVARRNDANLFLLHVIDTRAFQNISSFDAAMVEQISDNAQKTMDEYVQKAKAEGVKNIQTIIEYGAPKVVIAKQIPKKYDINLIMIGATGLNAVERVLVGSVTEYVTRHARCDVLVVRSDLDNKPVIKDIQ